MPPQQQIIPLDDGIPPPEEKEVNRIWKTLGGLDPFETMSALQKHIRRNEERQAILCAYELARSGKSMFSSMVNRLVIISHEDIGVADLPVVTYVGIAIAQMRDQHERKQDIWKLMLTNIIIAMCRAQKTRLGCHASTLCYRLDKGLVAPPEIPDYALDMHTKRGKKMGRGLGHFLEQGAILSPHADLPDDHFTEAKEYWDLKYKQD